MTYGDGCLELSASQYEAYRVDGGGGFCDEQMFETVPLYQFDTLDLTAEVSHSNRSNPAVHHASNRP